jgi:murein DD-endopeptidase MepM/ murein hydrolase activator NlpD
MAGAVHSWVRLSKVAGMIPFPRLRMSPFAARIGRVELFVLDQRDLPLYVAAVFFAVMANTLLLSMGVDRIVLSSAVRTVVLPPQRELVTRSILSPLQSGFSVVGEQTSVDTDRFSQLAVSSYTVRPGDTLGAIALEHDLNLDTLISFNRIDDVRRIQVGAQFQIPDRDGLLYTVRRGEALSSIAGEHGTTVNAILDANDLRSSAVPEGQVLFVPGARMSNTELRIILGELLAWPAQGSFTSGFGMRPDPFTGRTRFHNGIDLSNRIGTPIRAAASGRVVHVESQIGNYGRFVILRHPDGFQTLYAHLDTFTVRNGQTVARGQQIGTMGNTGRSTGPHLHFSVIHNGTFVNPMRYLH